MFCCCEAADEQNVSLKLTDEQCQALPDPRTALRQPRSGRLTLEVSQANVQSSEPYFGHPSSCASLGLRCSDLTLSSCAQGRHERYKIKLPPSMPCTPWLEASCKLVVLVPTYLVDLPL